MMTKLKKILGGFLIVLSSLTFGCLDPVAAHTVTPELYNSCLKDKQFSLVLQAAEFQEDGLSKQRLIDSLDSTMPISIRKKILEAISYVYDKTHLINAPISYFTECLSKE